MKTLIKSRFGKSAFFSILVLFGFTLQSFHGVTIKKRHYRKGYYVHICNHKCKVKLEGTTSSGVAVQSEKSGTPREMIIQDVPGTDRIEETGKTEQIALPPISVPTKTAPSRSIAPVSQAINAPKN